MKNAGVHSHYSSNVINPIYRMQLLAYSIRIVVNIRHMCFCISPTFQWRNFVKSKAFFFIPYHLAYQTTSSWNGLLICLFPHESCVYAEAIRNVIGQTDCESSKLKCYWQIVECTSNTSSAHNEKKTFEINSHSEVSKIDNLWTTTFP